LPTIYKERGRDPKVKLFKIDGIAFDRDDYYHVMRNQIKGLLFSKTKLLQPLIEHLLGRKAELAKMVHELPLPFEKNLEFPKSQLKQELRLDFLLWEQNQKWKTEKPKTLEELIAKEE
jgi:hypothetical protein